MILKENTEEIVKRVYGDTVPEKIDMEKIAKEGLGLNVIYEEFAELDADRIAFLADGEKELSIIKNDKTEKVIFPLGTIVVDRFIKEHGKKNEINQAIAHECGHVIYRGGIENCSARFKTVFDPNRKYSFSEIFDRLGAEEAAADKIAFELQTPIFYLESLLEKFNLGEKIIVYGDITTHPATKLAMEKMMETLGISFTELFYRLKSAKLVDRRPLEEYVSLFCGN